MIDRLTYCLHRVQVFEECKCFKSPSILRVQVFESEAFASLRV